MSTGTDEADDYVTVLYGALATVSTGICAYHGYKRNESLGWALGWAFLGGLFPVVTPAIAFAQGFGEKQKTPSLDSMHEHPAIADELSKRLYHTEK